jgi:hypothetical protein
VKKPKRVLRRLFQAAVEIIKEMMPKATLIDFHQLRQFPQASASEFFLFVPFSFFPKI